MTIITPTHQGAFNSLGSWPTSASLDSGDGPYQGERYVFSAHSYKGGEKWQTWLQPRAFQGQAQTWPCCLHPLGAVTNLPLSRPFWSHGTNLKAKPLPDVASQDGSLMLASVSSVPSDDRTIILHKYLSKEQGLS